MFRQPTVEIKPWMRPTYLALTTLLGVIASYGLHAAIEIQYLRWAEQNHQVITWTRHFGLGWCALPSAVQYGLFIVGLFGGWLIGRVWWRIVYIERRWAT